MITLRRGPCELTLAPETGGAIAGFTFAGRDVLRPTPEGTEDVLRMACFPLTPFANRIAGGRFSFCGHAGRLKSNMGAHPHPLHGHGWRAPWTVESAGGDHAQLSFSYASGDWPWAYEAVQAFALSAGGLTISLTVTNRSKAWAPFGFGFHPYFPTKASARLTANVSGVWLADADCLPTRHVNYLPIDNWPAGAPLQRTALVDHCHTGWDGRARIDLPGQDLRVRMSASPDMRWLHIYAPPGEDFFCVEPVSHRPDALNAADPAAEGVRVLAPGKSHSIAMTLEVEAADGAQ